MGFPRQGYWSGLPFPSPGDLPDQGIEPWSPTPQADSLLSEPPGNAVLPWTILVDQPAEKPDVRRVCGGAEFLHCRLQWRRKWQPTPVSLPGESHGQRSLAGYSPWGCKSQTRLSDFTTTARLQYTVRKTEGST